MERNCFCNRRPENSALVGIRLRVCQFHLVLFGLQAESELVKAELQYFRKPPNTFRAVASKTKIEIFGGARRPGEAQFHSESAFQVVDIDDTFLDGALQNAAKCEKRDPTAKPFLIETLLASHTSKSLLQPLNLLRGHELNFPTFASCVPFACTYRLRRRVSAEAFSALM